MPEDLKTFLARVNFARYSGQPEGHYESFFLRANHLDRPLAFWIRYTLFSPKGLPENAIGELWAVFFNGETGRHLAVKQELPFSQCLFSPADFNVRVGEATLDGASLQGAVQMGERAIAWDLSYRGEADPLLLLPLRLYQARFPAAKSLVGMPLARFKGRLTLNGESMEIADWIGSQNHNWGRRHTDRYAWGQVAGFDNHPESFLEVATAKLKLGPIWTPPITPIVLRHKGQEYAFNGLFQSVRAHGAFDYFTWSFRSRTRQAEIEGSIIAPREAFVGLSYLNPPGGTKHCLNTKIASCHVQIKDNARGTTESLETHSHAAFEILTDYRAHGIPIAA
jgi:hypothetical protein